LSTVAATSFFLNDRERTVHRSGGTVLLDVLRDDFRLTGTKEGCREGDCGACSVLLGIASPEGVRYQIVNSCLFPLGEAAGCHVVTIEGLNQPELSPVQKALIDEGAIQCGFCTPGLVVALTAFLLGGASISEAGGIAALGGNICRCTGHVAIRRAVGRLCGQLRDLDAAEGPVSPARIAALVLGGILPPYFLEVSARLRALGENAAAPVPRESPDVHPPVLVAGGTDLFVTQAGLLRDADLDFLSRRENLRGIRVEGDICRIGAATPLAEIETSPIIRRILPELGRHFVRISSPAVRNRATIAGNIANGSPAGDLSVIILALDASVVLAKGERRRTIPLRNFFRGYKVMDMAADEMIAEILFPVPDAATHFHFEKVARRAHLDIAGVSSAIGIRVEDGRIVAARLSAGSVAPVPLFLRNTSAFLAGKTISAETARAAAALAAGEISPIDDVRGSAEYRRALLPRLILAHFLTLFPGRVREEDIA
jgi:xanthine dehydrogenase small subunit